MYNHEQNKKQFFEQGWCCFAENDGIRRWVESNLQHARAAVANDSNSQWLRCDGTWFVGVNVLPNATDSSVEGGPVLSGEVIDFIQQVLQLSELNWDRAQVSVCYPGYPKPMPSENEAAFRFRRDRDAAHVDGFLREGPQKRRHLREYHGFILGIPMNACDTGASPLAVWEGSHKLVRAAMKARFDNLPPELWGDEDITEAYHAVRQRIFQQCRRLLISVKPGETYLVHRLALHGISPWQAGANAAHNERMICYFRPEIGDAARWLFDA